MVLMITVPKNKPIMLLSLSFNGSLWLLFIQIFVEFSGDATNFFLRKLLSTLKALKLLFLRNDLEVLFNEQS